MFKFLTDTPEKKTALYFLGAVLVLAFVAVNGQKVRCRSSDENAGYQQLSAGNRTVMAKLAERALSACPASNFEFFVPPTTVTSGLYSNPRVEFRARQ